MPIGGAARRAFRSGVEDGDPVAEALGRHAEHATELAASEQPQPFAGHDRRPCLRLVVRALRALAHAAGGTRIARAALVCFWRNAASFLASDGSAAARTATANSAAFAAPASPIANVATGMPLGICTIDSSESSPRRYLDGTGTPRTGTRVFDASMPGRWAAPPAPAMIARRPRGPASSAYSNMSSGIRCADR